VVSAILAIVSHLNRSERTATGDEVEAGNLIAKYQPDYVMMYTLPKIDPRLNSPDSERNPHCSDFNTNHNPKTIENKRRITRLRTDGPGFG
jgi:hypothetical protein